MKLTKSKINHLIKKELHVILHENLENNIPEVYIDLQDAIVQLSDVSKKHFAGYSKRHSRNRTIIENIIKHLIALQKEAL